MIETFLTMILSTILYILLFGDSGYIIPTIRLDEEESVIDNDEEEKEYDDNNFEFSEDELNENE
jgi:hypothetical protein